MRRGRSTGISMASLAIAILFAGPAWSQSVGVAGRSIDRTNAAMRSIQNNRISAGPGASRFSGLASQSVGRANATMRSLHTNRAATIRGLSQQTVYRTPDNLYGVYWNMYYTNRARMRSVYGSTLRLRVPGPGGVTPLDELRKRMLDAQALADNQRRAAQEQARSVEILNRFDRRSPGVDPNGPVFDPETIHPDYPGADLMFRQLPTQPGPIPRR